MRPNGIVSQPIIVQSLPPSAWVMVDRVAKAGDTSLRQPRRNFKRGAKPQRKLRYDWNDVVYFVAGCSLVRNRLPSIIRYLEGDYRLALSASTHPSAR